MITFASESIHSENLAVTQQGFEKNGLQELQHWKW